MIYILTKPYMKSTKKPLAIKDLPKRGVKLVKETTNHMFEKTLLLATSAFGLVAALAWNDAIQSIFKYYFGEQSGIIAKLLYALIVTVIVVVITVWLGKLERKKKR